MPDSSLLVVIVVGDQTGVYCACSVGGERVCVSMLYAACSPALVRTKKSAAEDALFRCHVAASSRTGGVAEIQVGYIYLLRISRSTS